MNGYGDGPVIRILDGDSIIESPLSSVSVAEIADARPFRALSWYSGQRSFPGWYWASTMGAHVTYDSRLELARLLLADFDCSVEVIVAQPFQLVETIGSELRRHVPDFLLIRTDQTVTLVNVKTETALEKAKVRTTFAWVEEVLSGRGWGHEVWTGGNPTFGENVRFLAGFRRMHYPVALLEVLEREAPGGTFPEAELAVGPRWDRREARAAILHLLWWHRLAADLDVPLSSRTVLEVPP